MVKKVGKAEHDGIVFQPSALGAELFLWAFGEGDKALDYIFSDNFNPEIEGMPSMVFNSIAVKET